MTRAELVAFCEQEIREHSAKVRALLELLQAARLLPEDFGTEPEPEE